MICCIEEMVWRHISLWSVCNIYQEEKRMITEAESSVGSESCCWLLGDELPMKWEWTGNKLYGRISTWFKYYALSIYFVIENQNIFGLIASIIKINKVTLCFLFISNCSYSFMLYWKEYNWWNPRNQITSTYNSTH